jgi:transcriptional regulator with GAF, ATPase, and Fis domain
MSPPSDQQKKFPDFVPPTKISYVGDRTPTLHLRRCRLTLASDSGPKELSFDKGEVTLGGMQDNDVVIRDDTVSRYHCKIVQEDHGYVLVDLRSTNGTFVNKVRIREAFLRPGCMVAVGQTQLKFNAVDEEVEIVPSRKDHCADLIGRNPKMREIYSIIEKIAPTSTTVVIEGETGTGKEVVAQSIHKLSSRAKGPIIVVDCGAVPPNLIESELFGHEKGSFTGATMTRQGLFEMADGGTLFLDELGELPLDLQPKLLRALEQREIRRVGSAKPLRVDVRIIAATNRSLEEEVRKGRFRQDLFYRLSVVRLMLPALRERSDDIGLLVKHFLKSHRSNLDSNGTPRINAITRPALDALRSYHWPGNVRELVNCIERAVSFCDAETIDTIDLPEHIREAAHTSRGPTAAPMEPKTGTRADTAGDVDHVPSYPPRPPGELVSGDITFKDAKERWVSSFERDYIVSLLRRNNGNISHAARESDILSEAGAGLFVDAPRAFHQQVRGGLLDLIVHVDFE